MTTAHASPTSAATRPKVVVLGVGAMGRLHARVFAELAVDFALIGVLDPRDEVAHEVGSLWGVTVFRDEADAIEAADLVVVASPIDAHAGAVRRALGQGRHVLVEKPVCASASQALSLSRIDGGRLFVGHSERFNPVVRALRGRVRPGDIRAMRLRRTSMATRPNREHGVLVSLGVHDIDLVAHLSASPVSLREVTHLDDDRADLVIGARSGVLARLHVDRRSSRRERLLEVTTEEGVYTGDLLAKTLTLRPRGALADVTCPATDEEPLVAQALAVARALRGLDDAVATGVDGARALVVIEEATARARSSEPMLAGAP